MAQRLWDQLGGRVALYGEFYETLDHLAGPARTDHVDDAVIRLGQLRRLIWWTRIATVSIARRGVAGLLGHDTIHPVM